MDKKDKMLEIRKLYLIQFEKFETKVFFSWLSIFFAIFIAWTYGKIDGWIVIVSAIFTCLLDIIIECWRKKAFNKLINEIEHNTLGIIE